MTKRISIRANDAPIEMDYFVQRFVDHTVVGIVSSLEGVGDISDIDVKINGKDVSVSVNASQVPLNEFVSAIVGNTVRGMVSSLKGLVICIFAAVMAESLKVVVVTGAFLAGMFLAASPVKPRILRDVETIGTSFFIPLFFFLVGVQIDPTVATQPAFLLFPVIGISLLTKVGGAFLGA